MMAMEGNLLRSQFLDAMGRAATFVSVVTTDGEAGRFGVTVSSMTSVSADGAGPSLLVCIHHLSPAATAVLGNRKFCANLLHEGQQSVSDIFSGRQKMGHAERFGVTEWKPGDSGQPIISGATASFECNLKTSLLWETHFIIVGEVTCVHLNRSPDALLYGQRSYRRAVDIASR
jgi:flavin reductase (DIM6/NTAB) family NADH-FMN oxidoreductase RutF